MPVFVQFAYEFSVHQQTRHIQQYVNVKGKLQERGTRVPIADAMVVVAFPDAADRQADEDDDEEEA